MGKEISCLKGATQNQPRRKSGANKSTSAKAFHDTEFRAWVKEKLSYAQLAKRLHVSQDTVGKWARAENWEGLLKEIAEAARKNIVLDEAARLVKIKSRQIAIARRAQLAVHKMLKHGQISVDIFGNVVMKKGVRGETVEARRELMANELNHAVQALVKAGDLEFHRAGGLLQPAGELNVRFPELVALLESVWKAREQRAKVIDGKVIDSQPLALPAGVDPRESM